MRRTLYRLARLLGDVNAVRRGRLPQRIVRRAVYGRAFRVAGWISRLLGVGG